MPLTQHGDCRHDAPPTGAWPSSADLLRRPGATTDLEVFVRSIGCMSASTWRTDVSISAASTQRTRLKMPFRHVTASTSSCEGDTFQPHLLSWHARVAEDPQRDGLLPRLNCLSVCPSVCLNRRAHAPACRHHPRAVLCSPSYSHSRSPIANIFVTSPSVSNLTGRRTNSTYHKNHVRDGSMSVILVSHNGCITSLCEWWWVCCCFR